MPDFTSSLFRIYDEYKTTCLNIIENINTQNYEYLVSFVNLKGKLLKQMIIQENVVELTETELKKKNAVKLELLELEKEVLNKFTVRHSEIKQELSKVRKSKKLHSAYATKGKLTGKRVNLVE